MVKALTKQTRDIDPKSPTAMSWAWMRESQLKVWDLLIPMLSTPLNLAMKKNADAIPPKCQGARHGRTRVGSSLGSISGVVLGNLDWF